MNPRGLGLAVVVMLVALAAVPAAGAGEPRVDQPGVTDTTIRVGGVASRTNQLGTDYGAAFDGANAYFAMVNARGGVFGREIELVSERDDQLANNRAEVQALLSEDDVFAAVPIAPILFSGADLLAEEGIPTFGWNVHPEWNGRANLFGNVGAICFDCPSAKLPRLAQALGKQRVAILAYNVAQSADCAASFAESFRRYPVADVVVDDRALAFGVTDLSADVQQMKDADVDLVATCMEQNGVLTLAREMRKQGVDAIQYLPNAYDHNFLQEYGELFEGSYVSTPFAPFETRQPPRGLRLFEKWMRKTGAEKTELAVYGWVAADEFVTGLTAAGPNFTRQKVVDALNDMTGYSADGLVPPIDWTVEHDRPSETACQALTRIDGARFVPVFATRRSPFTCFENLPAKLSDVELRGPR